MLGDIVRYFRPKNLPDALELLDRYKDETRVIGGGTKFIRETGLTRYLVDLSLLKLTGIEKGDRSGTAEIHIGASVTLRELEESPLIQENRPELVKILHDFSTIQIKNLSTLAGSLIHPKTAQELAAPFMALGGEFQIHGKDRSAITLEDFYTTHKGRLSGREIVSRIKFQQRGEGILSFYRVSRAPLDSSIVNCAVFLEKRGALCQKIVIAFGGLTDTPFRARPIEELFAGKEIGGDLLLKGRALINDTIKPVAGIHATASYKQEMAAILLEKAIQRCLK